MTDWKRVSIGDCITLLGDGLHGTPQYSDNGEYAFINGNNLVNGKIVIKPDTKRVSLEQFEKYRKPLTDRTILVSINGTLGNVGVYHGEKIILGKSACYFNVKDNIDKDFIYYVVNSLAFKYYMENSATGTTIKNISLRQMREYSFKLPDIIVQRKISSMLKMMDKKIESNEKINDNLAYVMGLFKLQWYRSAKTCSRKYKYRKCIITRMLNSSRPKSREQSMAA